MASILILSLLLERWGSNMDGQQDLFCPIFTGPPVQHGPALSPGTVQTRVQWFKVGSWADFGWKNAAGASGDGQIISTQSEYTSVPTSSNIFHSDTCSFNLFITSHSLYTYIIYYIQHIHVYNYINIFIHSFTHLYSNDCGLWYLLNSIDVSMDDSMMFNVSLMWGTQTTWPP